MGVGFDAIREFATASWKTPGDTAADVRRMYCRFFIEKREKACEKRTGIKASASELLTLYPMIRRFAEVLVEPHLGQ